MRSPLLAVLVALTAFPAPAQAQRVREVQIAPHLLRLRPEAETRVLATAYDEEGVPIEVPFRWSSSNINVVTVAPDGLIRAVAPGTAIITAATIEGGRRRYGRITVHVVEPGMVRPPPAPPGPPKTLTRLNVDSIIRASVNCEEPFISAANPARACYDRRPVLRQAPFVTVPDACEMTPSGFAVLVLVGEDGTAREQRAFAPSPCPAFNDSAEALVRTLVFQPASREGRPVPAWIQVRVHPRRP